MEWFDWQEVDGSEYQSETESVWQANRPLDQAVPVQVGE